MDDAPHLYAHLLKLLIEHRCSDEDEIDGGGDPLTVEIMYLCADAELMKIEAFGQMITGRLTSDAVDLVLDYFDDPDLIDAACRLQTIEPMPDEKQADLRAVSERRMSMADFNEKWLRPTTWQGDPVVSQMQSEGIGLLNAITRTEQKRS